MKAGASFLSVTLILRACVTVTVPSVTETVKEYELIAS